MQALIMKVGFSALLLPPLIGKPFLSIKSEAKKEEQGKSNLSRSGVSSSWVCF